jgi:hypothetical protein
MRETARAEAVAYVTSREAGWVRSTADPHPITAA